MQVDIKWLAGFFDGEGCFYIGQQKAKNPNNKKLYPKAQILLSQSGDDGLALFEAIKAQYGGNIYKHLDAGQYKATKKAHKMWWNKDEGIELITALMPHLIIKKEAAQKVLDYLTRE